MFGLFFIFLYHLLKVFLVALLKIILLTFFFKLLSSYLTWWPNHFNLLSQMIIYAFNTYCVLSLNKSLNSS